MRLLPAALLALTVSLAGCARAPYAGERASAEAGAAATAPRGDASPTVEPAAAPSANDAVGASAAGAPIELAVTTLDGERWDLASRRGRWVVVNFWATWCAPCIKEMPELSALDAMREHVEVIGLAYEDIEPADMRAFLERRPVVYPVSIVDVTAPPAAFATPRGLPMTYLVAPDGRVAKQFLGPVTAHDIEAAIAAAGGPAAS